MEEFMMTQESFDRLWARVQGAPPPVPHPEDTLRRFLDETGETMLLERRLAADCGAPMAAVFRETRRRYLRLRTAYFLLTGCCAVPPSVCSLREQPLCLLRKIWLAARARSEAYDSAPAGEEALQKLYREMAALERAHTDALRAVIASMLG